MILAPPAWDVGRGGQAQDEAGVALPAAARRQHRLLAPVRQLPDDAVRLQVVLER